MYKLIVFDLDGTLADTLADLANAVNHALQMYDLPAYPVEDYRYFVGNGADNLIRRTAGEGQSPELLAQVKAAFSSYYAEHANDMTTEYQGVAGLLAALEYDGIMTAVISNKPHAFVPDILRHLYPEHRFTAAWGQQDGVARKPAPDVLLKLISSCKVSKVEVLYVGDSDVDVIFAHNAGVKVCGVSWGFRGRQELCAAGADMIADTAEELLDFIRGSYE